LSPGVLGLESGCTTEPIEEGLMIFVGDDWAEDHHDIHVMDEAGLRLSSRRLPEGLTGIGALHALIASHAEEPDQVVIGIETDRGLWVEALVAAGYQVFAINPLAVARYRERHHVSGAKSDAGDAKLLADLVRTDRHNHRQIAGDSATAEAIKVLARGRRAGGGVHRLGPAAAAPRGVFGGRLRP
jgi:transposase